MERVGDPHFSISLWEGILPIDDLTVFQSLPSQPRAALGQSLLPQWTWGGSPLPETRSSRGSLGCDSRKGEDLCEL